MEIGKHSLFSAAIMRYKFMNWENLATVRHGTGFEDVQLGADNVSIFPHSFAPHISALQNLNVDKNLIRKIEGWELLRYIDCTSLLELELVNPLLQCIVHNHVPFHIPSEMRAAAFRIYVDEGYHAKVCDDFRDALAKQLGISTESVIRPGCLDLNFLQKLRSDFLTWLGSCLVSESIITQELTELSKSESLCDEVKHLFLQHASDEGRHSVFFLKLSSTIYKQLNQIEKVTFENAFRNFADAYLATEKVQIELRLSNIGLANNLVEQVISQTYSDETCAINKQRGLISLTQVATTVFGGERAYALIGAQ